jgi:hypothetical protein
VPDLGCPPNAATAFDFLVGRGLRDFQAAAVVGNLQWESHLDPKLQAMDTNGLPGRGIAMWQPPRWANLLSFAAGRDPWALATQLDFLWAELGSYGLQDLLSTTTLEDATVSFQNKFENPSKALAHTDKRIEAARAALYACPSVKPPKWKASGVLATAALGAVMAAVGYGTYKLLGARRPAAPPDRVPPAFRPAYRPAIYRS